MQKSIPIGIFLTLAACGAAVTGANNAAVSATQKPEGVLAPRAGAPNAGDAWAGQYRGQFDGGRGTVEISSLGRSSYLVEISTIGQGTGCSGGANGTGVASANRMTMEMPLQFSPGQCRITLDRNGATLSVHEDNCLELHGAQCNFEGSVTRRGALASTPARSTSVAASSWIVGGWATRREDCWGNGLKFENGGVYYAVNGRGRWRLAGNTLTLVMTHETDGESDIPLRQPRRESVRVSPLSSGRMSWQAGNRAASVLQRCPADE